LIDLLHPGDILVANNSRVMPARLFGRKASGGKVEILLLKQIDALHWEALVGGKRLRPGIVVEIHQISLTIKKDLGEARRLIEFNQPIASYLPELGHMPLPPYIQTPLADAERYQTVFSRVEGSAAAPTAGLHFTPELLLALREKGIGLDYVTLHIGLDTFKPVTVEQDQSSQVSRGTAGCCRHNCRTYP
jgi:S-adenosylmethionine:tRNA ribosyltransferase-isomerase